MHRDKHDHGWGAASHTAVPSPHTSLQAAEVTSKPPNNSPGRGAQGLGSPRSQGPTAGLPMHPSMLPNESLGRGCSCLSPGFTYPGP